MSTVVTDFRSDTVTVPTLEMRQAMLSAPVGDDVMGDDPSVIQLESFVAQITNKEAAVFLPTGTMSNQIALRCQLGPMTSLLCDSRSHIYQHECGGVAFHSQAQMDPVRVEEDEDGFMNGRLVRKYRRSPDQHHAVTVGVALENTILGLIMPLPLIHEVKEECERQGMFLHLDGARIWNVVAETLIPLDKVCEPFDTVSLCLSKGLGAPVGSVLVGSQSLIRRARLFRKLFGGGWRQAGMLAAAGIYAINNHWMRMKEDHENAKLLAKGLEDLGFRLTQRVETNQVWISSSSLLSPPPLPPHRPLGSAVFSPYASRRPEETAGKRPIITFDEMSEFLSPRGFILPAGFDSARLVTHLQTPRSSILRLLQLLHHYIALRRANL